MIAMDIKWSELIITLYLVAELTGVTNGLNVGDKGERIIKDGFYIFDLSKWVDTGPIYCDEEDYEKQV